MSERTQSVLDGNAFVVGDRLGDLRIDEGREHGFFCDDTRMLSRCVLRVGAAPLELLGFDQSQRSSVGATSRPRRRARGSRRLAAASKPGHSPCVVWPIGQTTQTSSW